MSKNLLDVLLDVFSGPLISTVFPLYASIRAIENNTDADYPKLLMYWIIYSIITLLESCLETVIEWFPFWVLLKVALNCFLVIPYFNGAAVIYEQYVKQVISNPKSVIDNNPWLKDLVVEIFGILIEVGKYIVHNISTLGKLLHRMRRPAKSRNQRDNSGGNDNGNEG